MNRRHALLVSVILYLFGASTVTALAWVGDRCWDLRLLGHHGGNWIGGIAVAITFFGIAGVVGVVGLAIAMGAVLRATRAGAWVGWRSCVLAVILALQTAQVVVFTFGPNWGVELGIAVASAVLFGLSFLEPRAPELVAVCALALPCVLALIPGVQDASETANLDYGYRVAGLAAEGRLPELKAELDSPKFKRAQVDGPLIAAQQVMRGEHPEAAELIIRHPSSRSEVFGDILFGALEGDARVFQAPHRESLAPFAGARTDAAAVLAARKGARDFLHQLFATIPQASWRDPAMFLVKRSETKAAEAILEGAGVLDSSGKLGPRTYSLSFIRWAQGLYDAPDTRPFVVSFVDPTELLAGAAAWNGDWLRAHLGELLKLGARINGVTLACGSTPLTAFLSLGDAKDLTLEKLLFGAGARADLAAKPHCNLEYPSEAAHAPPVETPLWVLIHRCGRNGFECPSVEVLDLLLRNGANAREKGAEGKTPAEFLGNSPEELVQRLKQR